MAGARAGRNGGVGLAEEDGGLIWEANKQLIQLIWGNLSGWWVGYWVWVHIHYTYSIYWLGFGWTAVGPI